MSIKLLIKSLLRRKLVVALLLAQLAVTLALIVNSGLLALQARELLNADTGMDLQNTLVVSITPTSPGLAREPALSDLLERQLDGVKRINGVIAAAYSNQSPLKDGGIAANVYEMGNQERTNTSPVATSGVSTGFFSVLGVRLIEGDLPVFLNPLLNFDDPEVFEKLDIKTRDIVITESLAKHLFGDTSAVGRYTNNGRVVAVVSDFAGQRSSDNINYNIVAAAHMSFGTKSYVILVRVAPGKMQFVQSVISDKLRAIESNVDIFKVNTLEQQKIDLYSRERGLSMLLTTLSLLMLLVAMVSAYSNSFFHILKQHQEIGIKRALGASRTQIIQELFADVWLTTLIGCVIGVCVSLLLNNMLANVLIIPSIPLWLPLMTIGLLFICVTVATWHPAKIANAVSPIAATKSL